MIVCTKHPRCHVECELQQRAGKKLFTAQEAGVAAVLYLIDPGDRTHIALATIGVGRDVDRMVETQLALMELQMRYSKPE